MTLEEFQFDARYDHIMNLEDIHIHHLLRIFQAYLDGYITEDKFKSALKKNEKKYTNSIVYAMAVPLSVYSDDINEERLQELLESN